MEHPSKPLSQILSTHHPEGIEADDNLSREDIDLNCIRPTPSTHLFGLCKNLGLDIIPPPPNQRVMDRLHDT